MRVPAWFIALTSAACTLTGAVLAAAPVSVAPVAPVSPPSAKAVEFFEKSVRPVLAEQCLGCHQGPKAQGGLDLRSRAALLKGGALGPGLVPGDPDKSLLVQVLRYDGHLKMPPKGKLPAAQIEALTEWVKMGAPWPAEAPPAEPGKPAARKPEDPTARWAFQPVREPRLPAVKSAAWAQTTIDRFLLAKLEEKGLKPNPPADRRTLIRRATFDLTGLPPTPEQVDDFVNDPSPNAWDKVIERLLASPQYGERWGRHWLDVVRYADSNGLDENELFPNAWRYRDYVIKSFNEDRPFDRFIREQIAGDLLPTTTDGEKYERLVATGFLVMGPKVLAERDKPKLRMDVIDEQIDTTGRAFMGLTLGCARCHDHKFDPLPTRDYYSLAGIFRSTTTLFGNLQNNAAVSGWLERPLAKADVVEKRKAYDAELKKLQDALKKAKEQPDKDKLTADIKAMQATAPPAYPTAMAVQDGKVENAKIHIRGSHLALGEEAPRRFLTALGGDRQPPIGADRSGRLELANWIAAPENPLTARVMVNRIWQGHFGRGIVGSPDNFGKLGERPTHPELLDWLARRFVDGGWSVKAMHRLMMRSAAYQMSDDPSPKAYAKDPANLYLWRANRRRLEAEAIRDAMLWANGQIDMTQGGSLIKGTGVAVEAKGAVEYQNSRRSVYLPVVRTTLFEMFQVFDFVDPHMVTGKREPTTVSSQALFMMNSPFAMEQSQKFAEYLLAQDVADDDKRVELAYQRALTRSPSASEVSRARSFIGDYEKALAGSEKDPAKRRVEGWRAFGQALFASSEFRHID